MTNSYHALYKNQKELIEDAIKETREFNEVYHEVDDNQISCAKYKQTYTIDDYIITFNRQNELESIEKRANN